VKWDNNSINLTQRSSPKEEGSETMHKKIMFAALTVLLSTMSLADEATKEYKIVSAHRFADRDEVAADLNKLADEGWTVKAVVPRIINGGQSVTDIYLERDKSNTN